MKSGILIECANCGDEIGFTEEGDELGLFQKLDIKNNKIIDTVGCNACRFGD